MGDNKTCPDRSIINTRGVKDFRISWWRVLSFLKRSLSTREKLPGCFGTALSNLLGQEINIKHVSLEHFFFLHWQVFKLQEQFLCGSPLSTLGYNPLHLSDSHPWYLTAGLASPRVCSRRSLLLTHPSTREHLHTQKALMVPEQNLTRRTAWVPHQESLQHPLPDQRDRGRRGRGRGRKRQETSHK